MGMTIDEAKNKMDFLKKAYQKLIDEKVDSGKLVGDGVSGEWKAETPLDEAYKDIIEALDIAIKALEQTELNPSYNGVKTELKPCEDCISRESVRQLVCRNNDKYGYNDRFHKFTEECLQLPSVTPKTRWIPVSERLPEEFQCVLVTTGSRVDVCTYLKGSAYWKSYVLAWMPLPQPYTESEVV